MSCATEGRLTPTSWLEPACLSSTTASTTRSTRSSLSAEPFRKAPKRCRSWPRDCDKRFTRHKLGACFTRHSSLDGCRKTTEAKGRQLARRAVIVDPENQRSVRTLKLRGGPTRLRHRSDQRVASEILGTQRVTSRQTAARNSLRAGFPES